MPEWVVWSSLRPSLYAARIIDAPTAREAAEAYGVSVADLREGITLEVQPWKPVAAFHREYAFKGDPDHEFWGPGGPKHPVTLERPTASATPKQGSD